MSQYLAEQVEARAASSPRAWRLGFLYAAVFLVGGCYLPYLPVWLHWRDLDADQIALLLATPPFARVVFTPAISFAADRAGGRRPILIALAWGSLGSFLLLWVADGFWQMLLASLLLAANWTTILPRDRGGDRHQERRSRLRQSEAGSVSFIVASLGSGLIIGRLGPQTVLPLLVGGAALMVVGAHLVPHALARASDVVSALRRLSLSDAFKLLRAPVSAVLACSEPDPIEPRPLLQLRQSQLAGARHL